MACLFTEAAESDLEGIGDYIARDNPARAVSFVAELRARCEKLEVAPEAYPLVPDYGADIRRVPFGEYLVFYSIDDSDIVIVRILHGARRVSAVEFEGPS